VGRNPRTQKRKELATEVRKSNMSWNYSNEAHDIFLIFIGSIF